MKEYLVIFSLFLIVALPPSVFAFPNSMRVIIDMGESAQANMPATETYPDTISFYQVNSTAPVCLLPGCDLYPLIMKVTYGEKGINFVGTIFATIDNKTTDREARAIDLSSDSTYIKSYRDYNAMGQPINTTYVTRGELQFTGMFENGTEWINTYAFNESRINFDTNKFIMDVYFKAP